MRAGIQAGLHGGQQRLRIIPVVVNLALHRFGIAPANQSVDHGAIHGCNAVLQVVDAAQAQPRAGRVIKRGVDAPGEQPHGDFACAGHQHIIQGDGLANVIERRDHSAGRQDGQIGKAGSAFIGCHTGLAH